MVIAITLETFVMITLNERVKYVALLLALVCGLSMASTVDASSRVVVVAGLGGNADYESEFREYANSIADALASLTTESDQITVLHGAEATREEILAVLTSVATEASANTQQQAAAQNFVLVMLGHATINRDGWQFNLAGPDLSARDLVGALAPLSIPQQVIVASTSSSGALLKVLAQPGRTLITATKSGGEINAVKFTEFFAAALASNDADVDRNELLTVKEAFLYANERTVKFYEDEKLLASEHARFSGDDASNVTLATLGALRDAKNNPTVAALLEERSVLEKEFYAVKATKDTSDSEDYYARLEDVLIKIATLQRDIDGAIIQPESIQ